MSNNNPIRRRWRSQIIRERYIRLATSVGMLFFGAIIVLKVENLLLSVILAVTSSSILDPAVNSLERNGLSRKMAVSLIFLFIALILLLTIVGVLPPIYDQALKLKAELPKYTEGTVKLIQDIEARLVFISDIFETFDFSETAEAYISAFSTSLFDDLPKLLSNSVTTMFLAPFLTFFMLKDGRKVMKLLVDMVPNNIFEAVLSLRHQINLQIGSFIRARFIEAGIVGGVVWIGLWIINFPYAPLLALFAALTNLIPYIGPIVGMVPALMISLINGTDPLGLLLAAMPYLIAQVIDIFFIIPMVVAKIVDLHPITVIISFIIGAQIMGVLGMIIAIPVTSALKLTLESIYRHAIEFRSPE
ncbi:MAG: AI-2E family transporter [Bdellovibrionales bacterium]|nr:AI-2E family transporter [Bdellovibrionales bacterium]